MDICSHINFPLALDKTEWATELIVFLGMLLNGKERTLSISLERRIQVPHMVQSFKNKRKSTIKDLQKLAGHLNFINRVIVLGRAFMRCMYVKFSGKQIVNKEGILLKPHHHVRLDKEFHLDCAIWECFLLDVNAVTRPFIDLDYVLSAETMAFYSDATANEKLGFGTTFGNNWTFGRWEANFVAKNKSSIEFLELYGLCAGIFTWQGKN